MLYTDRAFDPIYARFHINMKTHGRAMTEVPEASLEAIYTQHPSVEHAAQTQGNIRLLTLWSSGSITTGLL